MNFERDLKKIIAQAIEDAAKLGFAKPYDQSAFVLRALEESGVTLRRSVPKTIRTFDPTTGTVTVEIISKN